MNTEMEIAITTTELKTKYDAACKRLLSHKIILAWIMKEVLKEYEGLSAEEIAANCIESEPQVSEVAVGIDESDTPVIHGIGTEDVSLTEGRTLYDIRFLASEPISGMYNRLYINVEAQSDFYPGYPLTKRGIYYIGRMISAQKGTEFVGSDYEKLKKVYSIWVCAEPPKKFENTIAKFGMKKENIAGQFDISERDFDLATMIILCLGDPEDDNATSLLRLLDILLSQTMSVDERKRILENEFGISMTVKLKGEIESMCNLSDGVERRGIRKGIKLANALTLKLIRDGRMDDVERAARDEDYLDQLLLEYQLKPVN